MTLWTTFAPGKICWELTYIQTFGKAPSSNWQKNPVLIDDSLQILRKAGIAGIRLVILPSELTVDGKRYDWSAIDTMLSLCTQVKMKIILCVGPFQFPYYPGIYLPTKLLGQVFEHPNSLDTPPVLWEYGMKFLEMQLERYGRDKRIYGFHFANEWPSLQNVSGKEHIKKTISPAFMLAAAEYLRQNTEKPIFLNTNIDATDRKTLKKTFDELFMTLGDKVKLGFDIYPSQETWLHVPLQKLRRIFESFPRSVIKCQKLFPNCEFYFAEVEAQPWGNGQAWYELIQKEADPNKKVLTYSTESLEKTWKKYIAPTKPQMVSLWGADFWLAAEAMRIGWPLEQINEIGKSYS